MTTAIEYRTQVVQQIDTMLTPGARPVPANPGASGPAASAPQELSPQARALLVEYRNYAAGITAGQQIQSFGAFMAGKRGQPGFEEVKAIYNGSHRDDGAPARSPIEELDRTTFGDFTRTPTLPINSPGVGASVAPAGSGPAAGGPGTSRGGIGGFLSNNGGMLAGGLLGLIITMFTGGSGIMAFIAPLLGALAGGMLMDGENGLLGGLLGGGSSRSNTPPPPGTSGATVTVPAIPPLAPGLAAGVSGPAASGPAASGPRPSGPAASGPAASGPAASGPAASGPAASGPAASAPAPAASGPAASGPRPSGPAASAPAASAPAPSSNPRPIPMNTRAPGAIPGFDPRPWTSVSTNIPTPGTVRVMNGDNVINGVDAGGPTFGAPISDRYSPTVTFVTPANSGATPPTPAYQISGYVNIDPDSGERTFKVSHVAAQVGTGTPPTFGTPDSRTTTGGVIASLPIDDTNGTIDLNAAALDASKTTARGYAATHNNALPLQIQGVDYSAPVVSAPAASGPAASGPRPSGPAASGPAASGPAASGPAASGPAASGPRPSGPAASGPAASGPAASGPAASGPAASGPAPAVSLPPVIRVALPSYNYTDGVTRQVTLIGSRNADGTVTFGQAVLTEQPPAASGAPRPSATPMVNPATNGVVFNLDTPITANLTGNPPRVNLTKGQADTAHEFMMEKRRDVNRAMDVHNSRVNQDLIDAIRNNSGADGTARDDVADATTAVNALGQRYAQQLRNSGVDPAQATAIGERISDYYSRGANRGPGAMNQAQFRQFLSDNLPMIQSTEEGRKLLDQVRDDMALRHESVVGALNVARKGNSNPYVEPGSLPWTLTGFPIRDRDINRTPAVAAPAVSLGAALSAPVLPNFVRPNTTGLGT